MERFLLLIEQQDQCEILERLLTEKGIEVTCANSPEEAMTCQEDQAFDMALLDCDLYPDGPAGCLRAIESCMGNTITILVSHEPSAEDVVLAMRKGAFDFFLKPINQDLFCKALERGTAKIEQDQIEQSAKVEMKRWSRHLAIINEIGRRAASIQNTKELMEMAATQVHSRFGYYHVYFGLIDEKSENWTVVGQAGSYGSLIPTGMRAGLTEGITGKTARTGESILINDITGKEDLKPLIEETRSELCIPVKSEGKTVGLINIESNEPNVFTETDKALLETLADQIGGALRNIRLFEREKETKEYLEALFAASCDAIVTTDPKGIVTFFSPGAESMYGYDANAVEGQPVYSYYKGGKAEAERIMKILHSEERAKNIETVLIAEDGKLVYTNMSASLLRDKNGIIIGTLGVSKDITERVELENRLKELTITDSLTGLYNQRFFYAKLESEVERAKRQRRELALMLFDLDKFKFYNDTFGHLEGDRILKQVGSLVKISIRKNVDAGFRYGGDEFVIILPELSEGQLQKVCNRIQRSIEQGLANEITLSAGVVRFMEHYTTEHFVKLADEAMYASKRSGNEEIVYR
ncbi:diguanylate cyclase [Acidobacteriota bacterium]